MLMVSGDLPHVKFGPWWLVDQNSTALPILVMAKTAPSPPFRLEHQSTPHRILMHIAKLLRALVLCENNKIVEATLPNMALF